MTWACWKPLFNDTQNKTVPADEWAACVRVVIRQIRNEEDYQAIARLRYDVYVEEMGKRLGTVDNESKTLVDELDSISTIYGAFDGSRAVATGRIVPVHKMADNDPWRNFYSVSLFPVATDKQVIYGKLMVSAEYRGSMAIPQILIAAYEEFRGAGMELGFLHCAPSLVPIYEVVGCRRYKKGEIDPDVGLRLPMVQLLGDLEHFARVKSPILSSVKKFPASPDLAKWFKEALPHYSEPASVRMMSEENFLKTLSMHVNHESSPLFDGLESEEILRFVRASSVVEAAAGDTILRKGDADRELYLILDGAVEISTRPNGTKRLLHTLGYGQFFGESSFLLQQARSTDAVAIAPTKLLSIGAENFEKIRANKPELAAKVLFNLSRVLCERLY